VVFEVNRFLKAFKNMERDPLIKSSLTASKAKKADRALSAQSKHYSK